MNLAVNAFFQWKSFSEVENEIQTLCKNLIGSADPILEQFQEDFLKLTLHNAINLNFPVLPESRCTYFKKFVKLLEMHNVEVNEEFYKACVIDEQDVSQKDRDFYKSYFLSSENLYLCSLIETREFVSQGTTGLSTWPAALFLLNVLMKNENIPDTSVLLELGSGIGLTGLSLLRLRKVGKIIFTDHNVFVLQTLEKNAVKNEVPKDKYVVQTLDWENNNLIPDHDITFGSDIVFDQRIIPSLVKTIKTCLKKSKLCIIANVERNLATREIFEETLIRHQLVFNMEKFDDMLLYKIT